MRVLPAKSVRLAAAKLPRGLPDWQTFIVQCTRVVPSTFDPLASNFVLAQGAGDPTLAVVDLIRAPLPS